MNENFSFYVTDRHGYLDYNQDGDEGGDHVFFIRNLSQDNSVNNDIRFQTSSQDRLTIKTDGNIGIGTVYPKEKLDLKGTARFTTPNTGLNYLIKIGGSTHTVDNAVGIGFDPEGHSDSYLNRIKTAIVVEGDGSGWSRGKLHILQSNNETSSPATLSDAVFTIDRYGKVGIGTTNPDSKLSVNGIITSREIKVTSDGWPDFVFENDYKLPTLIEVENHIIEKGHLKDIPSAKEVTKNGVSLGEMNAKLLQKVEELTLYMIEMNKRMNLLETENSALKTEVKTINNTLK